MAAEQTELFRTDMTALRVLPPNDYVAATEGIDLVTGLVASLAAAGLVYQVTDDRYPDWYFRCTAVPSFGELSHLERIEQLR